MEVAQTYCHWPAVGEFSNQSKTSTHGVRPGGEAGPFCPAGEGPLTLTLKQDNRTILVRRDFPQEVAEREKLWRRCQTLQQQVQVEAPDVREALEILLELQGSGVRLEWPAQKPWRLKALDRKQGLALQALQDGDWFEIRGQVKVDESLQLEVQRLLELTRSARGGSLLWLTASSWL